jgi:hypothetical protein
MPTPGPHGSLEDLNPASGAPSLCDESDDECEEPSCEHSASEERIFEWRARFMHEAEAGELAIEKAKRRASRASSRGTRPI